MAVGTAFYETGRRNTTLTEAWNGTTWRVRAAPTGNPVSSLYAVSCTSASACTAVGSYDNSAGRHQALVERWNGTTWRIQAIPRPSKSTQLVGVSCAKALACTAVGYQSTGTGDARPLAESWNGKKWQVQAVPLPHPAPGGLFGAVSCTSPSACMATGTDFDGNSPTLAERWNGKSWRIEPTPSPPNHRASFGEVMLDGVSCTSAKACAAIGEYSPGGAAAYFLESWNGTKWQLEPAPHPVNFAHGALLGISCVLARCTAVGGYTGNARLQDTLAMAN
jgi:hypothetical protein